MIGAAMRYLRMLTNAMVGGVLGAAYLAVLVLQLNPQVPIVSITAARWFGALVAFYGLYLSVALYLLILVREVLASRPLQPAWISVRLAGWVSAVVPRGRDHHLGEPARVSHRAQRQRRRAHAPGRRGHDDLRGRARRHRAAPVFVRPPGSRTAAALLLASMALSVAVPLWLRGPGDLPVPPARPIAQPTPPSACTPPRVRIIALDGAWLGFIRERVAAGQLPNFATLLERGADDRSGDAQADPGGAGLGRGGHRQVPAQRRRPIQRALSRSGRGLRSGRPAARLLLSAALALSGLHPPTTGDVGVAARAPVLGHPRRLRRRRPASSNWPLTHPARAELGYIVSDRFDEAASEPLRLADAQAGWPTTAADIARETFDRVAVAPVARRAAAFGPAEPEPSGLLTRAGIRAYSAAAVELEQEFAPRLTAVRYEGLDTFGHRYFGPRSRSCSASPAAPIGRDRCSIGTTRTSTTRWARPSASCSRRICCWSCRDSAWSRRRAQAPAGAAARLARRSGSHERAPDGFLLAYGANVTHGVFPAAPSSIWRRRCSTTWACPSGATWTASRASICSRARYRIEHPVRYIASHEK